MNKNAATPILPSKPPLSFLVLATVLLLLGVFVTPELLIYLGPMKKSLLAENELIRNTTLVEVEIFRIVCFILSFLVIGVFSVWKRILRSKTVVQLNEYQEAEPTNQNRPHSLSNCSLFIVIVGIAAGIMYVGIGDLIFEAPIVQNINKEDGVIEQASAILFLSCSIIAILIAVRSVNRNRRIIHAILAIGFFLFLGEEISWGQRIFGFQTNELIKNINVQNENNIHNLLGYFADHLFIAGVFFFGVVLTVLRSVHPFWDRLFRKIGLPIASIGLATGFFLISLLHDWTVYALIPSSSLRIAELRELLTGLAFLLLMRESMKSAEPVVPKTKGGDEVFLKDVIEKEMLVLEPPREQTEPQL